MLKKIIKYIRDNKLDALNFGASIVVWLCLTSSAWQMNLSVPIKSAAVLGPIMHIYLTAEYFAGCNNGYQTVPVLLDIACMAAVMISLIID